MKKIVAVIMVVVMSIATLPLVAGAPVFADGEENKDGCYKGAILSSCDDGSGSSIMEILRLVVNIMTVGVGILGVVGITVVGIQYLTAGGSEEKTRTAKRRMLEIVIGLAVYAVAYGLLSWLLPGFSGV